MDFDLSLARDGKYAVLTNYTDVDNSSALDHQRAMRAFNAVHGVSRFLIDTRGKRFTGSVLDTYTFVRSTLPEEGFDTTWRVALITAPDDDSHDFLATVSYNAGFHVRIFKTCNEAIAWLDRE